MQSSWRLRLSRPPDDIRGIQGTGMDSKRLVMDEECTLGEVERPLSEGVRREDAYFPEGASGKGR